MCGNGKGYTLVLRGREMCMTRCYHGTMHTRVGIIVSRQDSGSGAAAAAQDILQKYDHNLEVEPYKEYPEESYVRQLLKNYKARSLEDLVASGADWKGDEEGGIDKKGLYFITTKNPHGAYDYWTLLHESILITPEIFTQTEYKCGDIITPDGVLHKGPVLYSENHLAKRLKGAKWNRQLREFAQKYENMSLTIFDCHS